MNAANRLFEASASEATQHTKPVMRASFPRSSMTESAQEYYAECKTSLREWLVELFKHLGDGASNEHDLLVLAEHHAIRELDRPMRDCERTALFRGVRDVRGSWLALRNAGAGR